MFVLRAVCDEFDAFGNTVSVELRLIRSEDCRKLLKRIIQRAIIYMGEDDKCKKLVLHVLLEIDCITVINHKFMVPGRSRMECDSDHARIEKARKRYPPSINHPYD